MFSSRSQVIPRTLQLNLAKEKSILKIENKRSGEGYSVPWSIRSWLIYTLIRFSQLYFDNPLIAKSDKEDIRCIPGWKQTSIEVMITSLTSTYTRYSCSQQQRHSSRQPANPINLLLIHLLLKENDLTCHHFTSYTREMYAKYNL